MCRQPFLDCFSKSRTVVSCAPKNDHLQHMCLKHIGLRAFKKYDDHYGLNSQHSWRQSYVNLKSTKIFTWIMNKIFIMVVQVMTEVAMASIWTFLYQENVSQIGEVGYLGKNDHGRVVLLGVKVSGILPQRTLYSDHNNYNFFKFTTCQPNHG